MVKGLPSGMTKTEEGLLEVMWFCTNEMNLLKFHLQVVRKHYTQHTAVSTKKEDVSVRELLKKKCQIQSVYTSLSNRFLTVYFKLQHKKKTVLIREAWRWYLKFEKIIGNT